MAVVAEAYSYSVLHIPALGYGTFALIIDVYPDAASFIYIQWFLHYFFNLLT